MNPEVNTFIMGDGTGFKAGTLSEIKAKLGLGGMAFKNFADLIADNAVITDSISNGAVTTEKLSFIPQTKSDRLTELSTMPMTEQHFVISDGRGFIATSPYAIKALLGIDYLESRIASLEDKLFQFSENATETNNAGFCWSDSTLYL
jgi:hypothetical protein